MKGKARQLDMFYEYDECSGLLTMADGVTYTVVEALHLSRRREADADLRAIHGIKQVFDGEIVGTGPSPSEDRLYPLPDRKTLLRLSRLQVGRGRTRSRGALRDSSPLSFSDPAVQEAYTEVARKAAGPPMPECSEWVTETRSDPTESA